VDASVSLNKLIADLSEYAKELPGISSERLEELRQKARPGLKSCIHKYRVTKSAAIDWMRAANIEHRSVRRLFIKDRESYAQVVEDAVAFRELAIMAGEITDFQTTMMENALKAIVAMGQEHNKQIEAKLSTRKPADSSQEPRRQDAVPDMIDLDQAAALVNRNKRTLKRYKDKGIIPPPKIQGKGGKKSEWLWAELRPVLEANFDRKLPDRPPHVVR
jgi:hypothetical protein